MNLSSDEQKVYKVAGGGGKGEQAVIARRKYMAEYNFIMSREMRIAESEKYFARNEKENVTMPVECEEDT